MRQLSLGFLVLALAAVATAADDLQPAVDTSAVERAAVTTQPGGASALTPALPASRAAAKATLTPPAADSAATAAPKAVASSSSSSSRTGGSTRDRVELENSQITGNRELPKVMYVVPWKKPDLGDFGGRPAKSLLDELLAPVDRDVFKRQNRYFEALQPDAAAPRSGDEK